MTAPAAQAALEERGYPREPATLPRGILRSGPYTTRFARTAEDLVSIQRLRFDVFNLELGEGLDSSYALGRDEDEFDAHCHHLLVEHQDHGVVGTYRLMTAALAAPIGFYAQTELDFSTLPPELLAAGVELGRACVHRAHRNAASLTLLWRGIARYVRHNQKRYLFGCCSLPTLDEASAWRLARKLAREGLLHGAIRAEPPEAMRCAGASSPEGDAPALPPLFASYLAFGSRVCSPPVIDRAFKVIDFFLVLDTEHMEPRQRRKLMRERRWEEPGGPNGG